MKYVSEIDNVQHSIPMKVKCHKQGQHLYYTDYLKLYQ
jgi:hypothetical protein